MKKLLFYLLPNLFFSGIFSQTYYLPYNVREAYNAGTRSIEGIPGANYFQNSSDYAIQVKFDPVKGILNGKERIVYHNNSNDTLNYLVVRIYHDILKKGALRDEAVDPEWLTDGVDITGLTIRDVNYVNGKDKAYFQDGTNIYLAIPDKLKVGDSLQVEISWQTELPAGHLHRFGNYGPGDWFIAYWYPQIAVYDDIDGWDTYDYTGTFEFYNDFNNYDVEIEVPSNYLVWATGNLTNQSDVYSDKIIDRLSMVRPESGPVHIVTKDDRRDRVTNTNSKKILYKYQAENVTDFSFAVSDSYLWDACIAVTDKPDKLQTVVHTVYDQKSRGFEILAGEGSKAVEHFASHALGVPYPYQKVVVFNGDGGMEFPMMVNMRSASDNQENIFVAMHEIFHGYFPFMMGLNERKYAWMDEGLTSYLPIETESEVWGNNYFQLPYIIDEYNAMAGLDIEEPLMEPSAYTRYNSYYNHTYYRSSVALSVLEQYIGRDKFREIIRAFILVWKGKHPTGFDFIFFVDNHIDEDLSWLITPWFFGSGWADLGVKSATQSEDELIVEIENVGGFPLPVELTISYSNGETEIIKRDAGGWKNDVRINNLKLGINKKVKSILIGSPFIPDKTPDNNTFVFD